MPVGTLITVPPDKTERTQFGHSASTFPLEADREDAVRPIVSMQMPPLPTLRSFFSELLRSLECTVIIGSRISELEHDALRQLKKAKPRILAIDEIHHLLACTPREQRAALNVLKFLSNELRVSI